MKLFRPHRVIPNTLDPGLENLDWIAIDNMFSNCLSPYGKSVTDSIREDVTKNFSEDNLSVKLDSWAELAGDGEKGDVTLKNLEGGDEAIGLATQWITPDEKGLKKLQRIQEHLPESLKLRLEKGLSWARAKIHALAEERSREESQIRSELSEETDEDFYDDKGNTAHRIFAGSSFVRSDRSFSAPVEEEAGFYTPTSSPKRILNRSQVFTASPTPSPSIFNQKYADWFTPITPPKQRHNFLPKTPEPKKITSILSPSATKVNTVRLSPTSRVHLEVTSNLTSQTLVPSNLAPAPSSASTTFTSTLSPNSTERGKTSPSPSTAARRDKRRTEREERRKVALKLGRARPDLVTKEFTQKFLGHEQEERY